MSKISQKLVAFATIIAVAVMLAPVSPAKALTAAELQAQIEALQAQLAQLMSQLSALEGGTGTGTGVPAACVGITFSRNLTIGSTGTDVKCLQTFLNQDADTLLASSGAGSPGNETSYFGPITKAAAVKFQEKYASEVLTPIGLSAGTGFVGSMTRAKLNSMLSSGTGTGTGTGTTVPTGAGLTVSLADDNPAAATIVADSTSADGAQSLIPFLKVRFTNGDNAAVKVTNIDFKRSGISADADISQSYIYEGNTLLYENTAFSDTVLSFNKSSGLFTVPAGGSKVVTLRCDLANGTASGKTIRFSVESASAVTSDASSINGSYPLVGNYMSSATASDLGELAVATTTAPSSTIDPQDNVEVMNFSLAGSNQILEVRKLKFTNIGSTDADDLTNFKLYDGGAQIGDTIASMDSDKTVTFDLTSNPLTIDKGITKTMHLKADIVGGTNRTFQFTVQEMTDITVYDTQYGVYIKPYNTKGATNTSVEDSWTILYGGTNGSATTINTGKMTLSRASDSPSGNVAKDATNVTVAKFDVKATGENAKISTIVVEVYGSISDHGLYQGKIYYDGVQKGDTTNLGSDDTAAAVTTTSFTFGNTFIVEADGDTHTLEVKADIKKGPGNAGAAFSGDETLTVKINSVTATGRTSSQTVSVSSATAHQLTVKAGTIAASKNQSYSNWSASYPTAIKGQVDALVGSFVISGGSSEGADVTAIQVEYTTTTNDAIQNLRLYQGDLSSGTQIGSTQSTVTANSDYTFYPSPYISLAANEQVVVNVYADVLTGASTDNNGKITVLEVDGTGKVTNTSVNETDDVVLQTLSFAAAGTLGINVDTASNPNSDLIIMGDSGVEMGKWKFSASTSAEDIHVTKVIATTTLAGGTTAPTSTLKNIKLYDGDSQIGSTLSSLALDGSVTFDLSADPWVIPAWSEKILTIKAELGGYPDAKSNSSTTMNTEWIVYQGAVSASTTDFQTEKAANPMHIYNTKPTVTFVGPNTSNGLLAGTQTLFEFKVKADDHASLNIYQFNFKISLTDSATTTNVYLDDIRLYDKSDMSTALSDKIATTAAAGTAAVSAYTVEVGKEASTSDTYDVGVLKTAYGTLMDEIPAGGEVTYILQATVAGLGAANEDAVLVKMDTFANVSAPTSTAVVWGDQYTTNIHAAYVKTLPAGPSSLDN